MVDIKKLKPAWFEHQTNIPQWIAKGIAQVTAEWAVFERELEELIRLLIDAKIEHGRIIVNWMSAKIRGVAAQHLIQSHILNDRLKPQHLETFTKIAEKIESLQTKRDIVAHGLWGKHEGKWCTLKVRQTRKTPELEPDLKKLARAVLPQRFFVTEKQFLADAEGIASAARAVEDFCRVLSVELAPLQNIPPKYSRRRRDYHPKPKTKVRKAPP